MLLMMELILLKQSDSSKEFETNLNDLSCF